MPSAYTASLRLVLPVTGELDGLWGDTVNNGLTRLLDDAIAGTAAVAMPDANYTLTVAAEAPDESRCMFVTLTGALTAQRNVVCPAQSKLYFVTNNTTGGQSVLFKTNSGTGVLVAPGQRIPLYCDGTNVELADLLAGQSISAEVEVASAATTTLSGLASNRIRVTGSATITSLGNPSGGAVFVRFVSAPTLTHNATTLILPGGANIVVGAGDSAIIGPVGSPATGWKVYAYQKASLAPGVAETAQTISGVNPIANGGTGQITAALAFAALKQLASETDSGVLEIATALESQAFSSNSLALTPARLATAFQGANIALGSTGYQLLPGNLIIQWGVTSIPPGAQVVSYPLTYPGAAYVTVASPGGNNLGNNTTSYVQMGGQSNFTIQNFTGVTSDWKWISVGRR